MLEKIGLPAKPALRGNNWVVDASHCQGCSSQFTFINRKHHCRRCGGIFCNNCTQHRMVLRGQGDSPVRICEPCKKIEEAARFEMRYGHRSRAGKGGSKLTSNHEDEVLNQILGGDRKELVTSGGRSLKNSISSIHGDESGASRSKIEEVTAFEETNNSLADLASSSPEELRQQAVEEKKKYKTLKAEGKSEEALKAFKRGKELERQAAALELSLRKNRKKPSSSNNMTEIEKSSSDTTFSGRKDKFNLQKGKEKDDLAAELRDLGWSDMDLHDADKKPASMSLEGELSTYLREVSQKTMTEKSTGSIDKTQVIALKKRAVTLKREGKLTEAKEELKKAKILEQQLEEQAFLADAEDSDDELSALIRGMDGDTQDDLSVGYEANTGFDIHHLGGIDNDLGDDSHLEVTNEDMDDPEIAAALRSLGWTDETNHLEQTEAQFVPTDREAILNEIQSLKREAVSLKRAGNTAGAMALLKKSKLLERNLDSLHAEGPDLMVDNPLVVEKDVDFQYDKNASKPNKTKSRSVIQKELLGLKKRALALRREGKFDEADEVLKRGKILEQQLEEMDHASQMVTQVSGSNKHVENIIDSDVGDGGEGEVTDQDMHDSAYLSALRNFGWKDEDDEISRRNGSSLQHSDTYDTQAASSTQFGASRRSKGEIQRQLLGLKRKALALRRQGENEEADEVLKEAKVLEAQLAEMETAKKEIPAEMNKDMENEISRPLEDAFVKRDGDLISKEDIHDPAPASQLTNLELKIEVQAATSQVTPEQIARGSEPFIKDLDDNTIVAYEKREEKFRGSEKANIEGPISVLPKDLQKNQGSIHQEILAHKRKAVALKREGKLPEAREELTRAKLLEKSLEEKNAQPSIGLSDARNSASVVMSVGLKEHSPSNSAPKPLSSRDRFKLQQESLSHKRQAMKLRREGRMEEAEAEFELAKALEAQLEELATYDSSKSAVDGANPADDVGVEDFLDPQLLSALKAIGLEEASIVSQGPKKPEPAKPVVHKGEDSGLERIQLEEQIKAEKLKALKLKRSGKQTEALEALRRAKMMEKNLHS